jgi:hypothetical protein
LQTDIATTQLDVAVATVAISREVDLSNADQLTRDASIEPPELPACPEVVVSASPGVEHRVDVHGGGVHRVQRVR